MPEGEIKAWNSPWAPPGLTWVSFGVPRLFPKGFAGGTPPPRGSPGSPRASVSWPGFLLVGAEDWWPRLRFKEEHDDTELEAYSCLAIVYLLLFA